MALGLLRSLGRRGYPEPVTSPAVTRRVVPRRRRVLRVVGALAGLVGLGVAAVAAPAAWTWWNARGRVLTSAQAPSRDVAVIFGAEVYPSGNPSPYLRARLDLGVALFKAGQATVLIVSGDNADEHHNETTSMRRYLQRQGVPASRIVEDEFGLDTYDTCVRLRKVFGVSEALLVSQRYHLNRAVATCRAVGVDAVGVGDVSVKRTSRAWDRFVVREYGANLKMAVDLASRRDPVLEPPRDDVARALGHA